jgi:hypothetical protein
MDGDAGSLEQGRLAVTAKRAGADVMDRVLEGLRQR